MIFPDRPPKTTQRLPQSSRRLLGYTLVELMIVLVILAILGAFAYPSYYEIIRKGRRAEGRTALAELMLQQERYATQHNSYREFPSGADYTPFKTHSGDRGSSHAHYLLSAQACQIDEQEQDLADCVQLHAHPQSPDPRTGTLSYNSLGAKSCTGSQPDLCW